MMAEELNDGGRVAYLEARVGELNNTIGELRAENVDLDDRRARWAEEHEKRRDELGRSEASRQAWAEEALRVDPPSATPDDIADIVGEFGNLNTFLTEQVTEKLFEFYVFCPKPRRRSEPLTNYVCACSIDAEQVVAAGWVRPQCAVHPEGQGEIRAVPWTEEDAAAFEAQVRADGGEA